jgi:hypothetical protein
MKIISHRGNICGPVIEKENRPSYIDSAIQLGYDVEVDLRYVNNEFWLGHDFAQYKIELSWMEPRKEMLWFHCKDIDSALELAKLNAYKFFCHTNDSYVCTNNGYLWVHDLSGKIDNKCIIPLLSEQDIQKYDNNKTPYAVCTDFVNSIK